MWAARKASIAEERAKAQQLDQAQQPPEPTQPSEQAQAAQPQERVQLSQREPHAAAREEGGGLSPPTFWQPQPQAQPSQGPGPRRAGRVDAIPQQLDQAQQPREEGGGLSPPLPPIGTLIAVRAPATSSDAPASSSSAVRPKKCHAPMPKCRRIQLLRAPCSTPPATRGSTACIVRLPRGGHEGTSRRRSPASRERGGGVQGSGEAGATARRSAGKVWEGKRPAT